MSRSPTCSSCWAEARVADDGSASRSRIASVLLIDYYLQTPYDDLSVTKTVDFVTLAAYLVTAIVTSQLLDRAQRDRDAALRHADEVTRLAAEHEQMARETEKVRALREGDRMKDFVLASVSHDLRTPLTAIKALAQDEMRTGASRAGEIEEQVDRLTRMVADLLDLSRLRAGKWSFTPELNAAEDVIGAAIRQCAALERGGSIVSQLDEEAPALYGTFDFVQTLRILVNLLENALRFTDDGAIVELAASRDGQHLRVRRFGQGARDRRARAGEGVRRVLSTGRFDRRPGTRGDRLGDRTIAHGRTAGRAHAPSEGRRWKRIRTAASSGRCRREGSRRSLTRILADS